PSRAGPADHDSTGGFVCRPAANAYRPDHVSLPGETLQEVLDERQISHAELAKLTGQPKKMIVEIIEGKTAITPETAAQLRRVLGIPTSFWNSLEHNYQELIALQRRERC
ncbi:MAG TPA: helix-turn-helix domain-containing protein, partial [Thermoanaerobaculia bacterium]|nr:helix-turn-helix domain-containing protein [Thermoanaerobaculia bacterium]